MSEYRWEELLQLNIPRSSKESKTSRNHQRNSALRLVCYGELSRAARILCSKGLAPATQATVDKLTSKHPLQRQVPEYEEPKSDSLLNLSLFLAWLDLHPVVLETVHPGGDTNIYVPWLLIVKSVTIYTFCAVPLHPAHLLNKPSLFCRPLAWSHYQKELINDVRPIAFGEVFSVLLFYTFYTTVSVLTQPGADTGNPRRGWPEVWRGLPQKNWGQGWNW